MIYKLFLSAVLLTLASNSSFAQDSISLSHAIELALKNNIQIKQARLSESLAYQNLKSSKLAIYPSVNANSGLSFSFGRNEDPFSSEFFNTNIASSTGSISASLPVFQWSQKLKQISQTKYLLEVSKSTIKKVENDLTLSVVSAYLQILFNKDLLKAADLQLATANQLMEQEQKQFDMGNKTLVDLSQSKAQVSIAELKVSNASNQLQISYLNLAQLLELDPEKEIKIADIPITDNTVKLSLKYSGSEIYERAVDNYPAVKIAEFQTLAAAKNVEVTRSGLLPRLSLQGSISTGYSSIRQRTILNQQGNPQYHKASFAYQINENLSEYLGIGLSIPLFNGLSSRIALNRSRINLQTSQLVEQLEKNNLRKQINQSLLDLKAAESNYNSILSTYASSQIAYKAVEQRYNVGLVNSLTLSQAQTAMNVAQFEVIKAKYELIFKSKIIAFYLGEPMGF